LGPDDRGIFPRKLVLEDISYVKNYISPLKLAERWSVSRWTAVRVMHRFGYSGAKTSPSNSASVRFSMDDVVDVEHRMGNGGGKDVQ
jgi:hypothetical protein